MQSHGMHTILGWPPEAKQKSPLQLLWPVHSCHSLTASAVPGPDGTQLAAKAMKRLMEDGSVYVAQSLGLQESHLAPAGAAQHEQRCDQPDDGQASNPADHAANNGPRVAAATAAVVGGCADAVLQHTASSQTRGMQPPGSGAHPIFTR